MAAGGRNRKPHFIQGPNPSRRERTMKVKPLHDRVLVKRVDPEEKVKGGIIIPDTAKEKPLEGKVVAVRAGPRGRNVVLEKKFGSPTSTKDGVTVAKEIELEDPKENMGAQLVREVASKTSEVAGDGTTTATVLAQAIYREGVKAVTAGANPMDLKRGIEKAVEKAVEEIKKLSKPVSGKAIAQVGTISANNDETSGEIIA